MDTFEAPYKKPSKKRFLPKETEKEAFPLKPIKPKEPYKRKHLRPQDILKDIDIGEE